MVPASQAGQRIAMMEILARWIVAPVPEVASMCSTRRFALMEDVIRVF